MTERKAGKALAGTIVRKHNDRTGRDYVVLNLTEDDITPNGTCCNAGDGPGLYCFSGMWYGDDPLVWKNFGKMLPLDGTEEVVGHVGGLSLAELKSMVC